MYKFKIKDKTIIYLVLIFFIISITSIYCAQKILPSIMDTLVIKQIIWYSIGFILIFIITRFNNNSLYKHYKILYLIFCILLFLLLIFGKPINDAKCWFKIPGLGNFQPSEFMKIILIITLAQIINKYNKKKHNIKEELFLLIKILVIIGIPSFLTFLEPDTGVVLIYLIITIIMLFIGGIRLRWFIILFVIFLLAITSIL